MFTKPLYGKNIYGGANLTITKKKDAREFLTYKGKPLVRRDNVIYYGNFDDKVIIVLTITDSKKFRDLEMATNVMIELRTNEKNGRDRVLKKADREGISRALDIAVFWLEEALEQ